MCGTLSPVYRKSNVKTRTSRDLEQTINEKMIAPHCRSLAVSAWSNRQFVFHSPSYFSVWNGQCTPLSLARLCSSRISSVVYFIIKVHVLLSSSIMRIQKNLNNPPLPFVTMYSLRDKINATVRQKWSRQEIFNVNPNSCHIVFYKLKLYTKSCVHCSKQLDTICRQEVDSTIFQPVLNPYSDYFCRITGPSSVSAPRWSKSTLRNLVTCKMRRYILLYFILSIITFAWGCLHDWSAFSNYLKIQEWPW